MKTGFRAIQLGHPRPPWGGLGGPESQKWAIWGANENKLSWLFFIRNEILSLAPNYTLGPVKILVKKDFWSGSFPVRQAQKTRFSLWSVKVAKYFLAEFKLAFTIMNLLSTTGANPKIDLGMYKTFLGGYWATWFRAYFLLMILGTSWQATDLILDM